MYKYNGRESHVYIYIHYEHDGICIIEIMINEEWIVGLHWSDVYFVLF